METEPLKQLGINMSVTNLEAYALSKGINKAYSEMSQAEQTTLRYNYIMEAGKDAAGDFAKTLEGSLANQLRVAKNNIIDLAASIGNDLLPSALNASTGINGMINELKDAFSEGGINGLVESLGGILANVSTTIADYTPKFIELSVDVIESFCNGIEKNSSKIASAGVKILKAFAKGVKSVASSLYDMGVKVMAEFMGGIFGYNVSKDIEAAGNKLKKAFGNLTKDIIKVAKTVLPPLVNIISKLAKNMNILVPILVAGYTAFKAYAIVKTISTAMNGMTLATKLATMAQAALNSVMNANPLMLLVSGIAAVTTGLGVFALFNDEANDSLSSTVDKAKEAAESYKEFKNSISESESSTMAEYENIQSLWAELKTLADENGNVTEANRARAQFIIDQLNPALGTEITMTDGVIQKYGELCSSIDTLIAKQRAEALLSTQKDAYTEAIQKKDEVTKTLIESENALSKEQEKNNKLHEEWNDILSKGSSLTPEEQQRLNDLNSEIEKSDANLNKLTDSYESNKETLKGYYNDISTYEENYANATQGNYDKIKTINGDLVTDFKLTSDSVKGIKEEEVKALEDKAKMLRKALDEGWKGVTEDTVKNAEENAKLAREEFEKVGKNSQEGVKSGIDNNKKKVKDSINSSINEAKSVDTSGFVGLGANIVNGIINGISNNSGSLMSKMGGLAGSALTSAKKALDIHSPSRKFRDLVGAQIPAGVAVGIEKEIPSLKDRIKRAFSSLPEQAQLAMSDKFKMAVNQHQSNMISNVVNNYSGLNNSNINLNNKLNASIEVPVYMDGREVARGVAPYQEEFSNYYVGR